MESTGDLNVLMLNKDIKYNDNENSTFLNITFFPKESFLSPMILQDRFRESYFIVKETRLRERNKPAWYSLPKK